MKVKFSRELMECTEMVCGRRRVGGEVRKGSEWWCEVVRLAVAEKRDAHEEWLQWKAEASCERYKKRRNFHENKMF